MAKKEWIVKGKIRIDHHGEIITKTYGSTSPLSGVQVELKAKVKGTPRWKSWGTKQTKSDGSFQFKKVKDRLKREFKLFIRYKSSTMVIYGDNKSLLSNALSALSPLPSSTAVNAFAILNAILTHVSKLRLKTDSVLLVKTSARSHGTIDLGSQTVKSGKGDCTLDTQKQGNIWYLYSHVRRHLKGSKYGQAFAFNKRIAVKYPHNNLLIPDGMERPYCSPLNDCIYIVKNSKVDYYDISTLLHELMHLWTYGTSTKENGLATQLILKQDTWGGKQKPWVIFHEIWATFSSWLIREELFRVEALTTPYGRPKLRQYDIKRYKDLDDSAMGWFQLFKLLTCPNLPDYDLNKLQAGSKYAKKGSHVMLESHKPLGLKELMAAFLDDYGRNNKQMQKSEMTVDGFINRLEKALEEFSSEDVEKLKTLLDPNETVNPIDLYGIRIVPGPFVPPISVP